MPRYVQILPYDKYPDTGKGAISGPPCLVQLRAMGSRIAKHTNSPTIPALSWATRTQRLPDAFPVNVIRGQAEHHLMGWLNIPVVNTVRFSEPNRVGHRHDLLLEDTLV